MVKLILVLLFNIIYLNTFSQDKIPVTLIKKDNSRLKCYIKTYEGKIISGFTYKIWINNEKIKIDRSEVKEIITDKNKYITIDYTKKTRRGGQISSKKITRTAELLIDDNVKLCLVHSINSQVNTYNNITTTTGTYLVSSHYLISDHTSFINKTNFKKTVKNHFSNCDKLNLKIKSKELKFNQIKKVVAIGNNCN